MAKPKAKPRRKAPHKPLATAKRAAKKRKAVPRKRLGAKKLKALPWRVAYAADALLAQINARAPGRSRASDGSIGDLAHQSRTSDHNAWRRVRGQPVVGARDFTHDPRGGFDSYVFARSLVKDKRNWPYLKYVISNGQIWQNGKWIAYHGTNPHDHHAHVSFPDAEKFFDAKPTFYFDVKADNALPSGTVPGDRPAQPVPNDPVLRRGSKGPKVAELQKLLGIAADEDFGPATERAVKAYQTSRNLVSDGVAGTDTWRSLRAAKLAAPSEATPPGLASSEKRVKEYLAEDEGPELNVDPDEPGGASRYGVSITALSKALGHTATIDDLRSLTMDKAWTNVYVPQFWHRIGADKLPAGLNYAAFDFAVNSGPAVVDGDDTNNPQIIQDFLTQALKEKTVAAQIDKLCDLRLKYMQTNPVKWAKYKRGWTARVERVRARSKLLGA